MRTISVHILCRTKSVRDQDISQFPVRRTNTESPGTHRAYQSRAAPSKPNPRRVCSFAGVRTRNVASQPACRARSFARKRETEGAGAFRPLKKDHPRETGAAHHHTQEHHFTRRAPRNDHGWQHVAKAMSRTVRSTRALRNDHGWPHQTLSTPQTRLVTNKLNKKNQITTKLCWHDHPPKTTTLESGNTASSAFQRNASRQSGTPITHLDRIFCL